MFCSKNIHAEKYFPNIVKSNRNQIIFTIFWSILNQTEFHLFLNQSENSKYNLISVCSKKNSPCVPSASRVPRRVGRTWGATLRPAPPPSPPAPAPPIVGAPGNTAGPTPPQIWGRIINYTIFLSRIKNMKFKKYISREERGRINPRSGEEGENYPQFCDRRGELTPDLGGNKNYTIFPVTKY